ncbi:MAG TPA: DNA-processing protein DprA [Candidatus Saccharibacteria bacterium]|nr:DNA-processing protein DprA [Candidatus Saccharibacteria bacterium]
MLILSEKNQSYPSQLSRLHTPPKQLYIESHNWPEILTMPMLAVVGSRKPSPYGVSNTTQIVREVASKNICIVSGLALGTDSIAHKAALEVGGRTIAVLPSGLENVYPASHRNLAKDIVASGGALISEYTPKTNASYKGNFIQRNRIIAGLSNLIFIPEAAIKSGSLHTAQFAIDSGIDICAMPGHITNPLAAGCHNLIRSGAAIITGADDILNMLGISASERTMPMAANESEKTLLDLIARGVHEAEILLDTSKLPVQTFHQTLTMLEITGKIKPGGANSWFLA